MTNTNEPPARFAISSTATGVISIVDTTRKNADKSGIIGIFFADTDGRSRATLYAQVCAAALNAEAARRAKKE